MKNHRDHYRQNILELVRRGGAQGGAPDDADDKGADDKVAAKKGKEKAGDDSGGDAEAKALADRAAKLEADNKKLQKKADEAAKKEADEKAALEAKKAKEEGRLEGTLAETQKKLKDMEADHKKLLTAATLRAEAKMAKLPDGDKKRLERLKDKLPLADWLEEVDEYSATPADDKGADGDGKKKTPPTTGSVGSDRESAEYEPTDAALKILREIGHGENTLRRLSVAKGAMQSVDGGWSIFAPVSQFIEDMPRKMVPKLSHEEAAKRRLHNDAGARDKKK